MERTDWHGEKAEVSGGGADMGIREWGLSAIFYAFVAPRYRNSHAETHARNMNIKRRHILALVTANMLSELAVCFPWVFLVNEGGIL